MKKPSKHNRRRRGEQRRGDHERHAGHRHDAPPGERSPDAQGFADDADAGGREGGPLQIAAAPHESPELADNELAATITRVLDAVRPHRNTILAGGCGLALLFAGYSLVSSQREATRAQSWDTFLQAMASGDEGSLEAVIRQHPDSDAARWARLTLADLACTTGTDLLFADRPRAEKRLDDAIERYGEILRARPRGMLAERATFGLAKARESRGQLAEARQGYEVVARDHAGGGLATLAAFHARDLERDATRQWYDWFSSASFAPPEPPAAPAADPAAAPPSAATAPPGSATPAAAAPAPAAKGSNDAPSPSPPPAAGAAAPGSN